MPAFLSPKTPIYNVAGGGSGGAASVFGYYITSGRLHCSLNSIRSRGNSARSRVNARHFPRDRKTTRSRTRGARRTFSSEPNDASIASLFLVATNLSSRQFSRRFDARKSASFQMSRPAASTTTTRSGFKTSGRDWTLRACRGKGRRNGATGWEGEPVKTGTLERALVSNDV